MSGLSRGILLGRRPRRSAQHAGVHRPRSVEGGRRARATGQRTRKDDALDGALRSDMDAGAAERKALGRRCDDLQAHPLVAVSRSPRTPSAWTSRAASSSAGWPTRTRGNAQRRQHHHTLHPRARASRAELSEHDARLSGPATQRVQCRLRAATRTQAHSHQPPTSGATAPDPTIRAAKKFSTADVVFDGTSASWSASRCSRRDRLSSPTSGSPARGAAARRRQECGHRRGARAENSSEHPTHSQSSWHHSSTR